MDQNSIGIILCIITVFGIYLCGTFGTLRLVSGEKKYSVACFVSLVMILFLLIVVTLLGKLY